MNAIKSFIKRILYFFSWETVYFTQEIDEFYKMKGILNNNKILVKSKITDNNRGHSRFGSVGAIKNSYEIMVKPEKVYLANELIHN